MDSFLLDYLDQLDGAHAAILDALDGLSQEAVDWSPGDPINCLGALIAHAMGAERYWIGDVAMQEPHPRDRAAELSTHGVSPADLRKRIEETEAYAHAALGRLNAGDLDKMRPTGRPDNSSQTVGWALAHALQHTALHAGHCQIMRDWWQRR
jgi:uncharacterized damage-inducible protein DinB